MKMVAQQSQTKNQLSAEFPNNSERKRILSLQCRDRGLAGDVDFDYVARQTFGLSGPDLTRAVDLASTVTNGNGSGINTSDLMSAVRSVVRSPDRQGSIYGPHDKKKLAFAAAGRAVVAASLGLHQDLEQVCILQPIGLYPGARADTPASAGASSSIPEELVLAAAGAAAEKLFFGEPAAPLPPRADQINKLADEMSGRLQMAPQQLIKAAEQRAADIVSTYRSHVEALASRLEEEETLSGQPLHSTLDAVHREAELFGGPVSLRQSKASLNGHSETAWA